MLLDATGRAWKLYSADSNPEKGNVVVTFLESPDLATRGEGYALFVTFAENKGDWEIRGWRGPKVGKGLAKQVVLDAGTVYFERPEDLAASFSNVATRVRRLAESERPNIAAAKMQSAVLGSVAKYLSHLKQITGEEWKQPNRESYILDQGRARTTSFFPRKKRTAWGNLTMTFSGSPSQVTWLVRTPSGFVDATLPVSEPKDLGEPARWFGNLRSL